jgi:hypothetical protein
MIEKTDFYNPSKHDGKICGFFDDSIAAARTASVVT